MKSFSMVNSSILMLLLCLILLPIKSVQGLGQNEITPSFFWSKSDYYQGEHGSVTISLRSTCGDELEFTLVGIHFAWMPATWFLPLDLRANPLKIPSGGVIVFSPINFTVPTNASVGWNQYYVRIWCNEHRGYSWTKETWTSIIYQIYIHDAYEKNYNDLQSQVHSKINNAQSANYESPEARSLLSQIWNEYLLAGLLANERKWQDAVPHLNTASNLLAQAAAKEQQYQQQKQQQLVLIVGGVSAIVSAAIIVIVLRRKRKPVIPTQT